MSSHFVDKASLSFFRAWFRRGHLSSPRHFFLDAKVDKVIAGTRYCPSFQIHQWLRFPRNSAALRPGSPPFAFPIDLIFPFGFPIEPALS